MVTQRAGTRRLTEGGPTAGRTGRSIPTLDASLTIVVEPQGQEIQVFGSVCEDAGSVTRSYRGKPVTGQIYVEQLGNWR